MTPWIQSACDETERAAAHALRHAVFCDEQAMFESDIDQIDDIAITIVALCPIVIGTVRIHESEPGLWFGSRLAVHKDWRRRAGLGTALIGHAVGLARAHGCSRFLAHIQAANVALFQSLHWMCLEDCTLHGRPHCLMQADLAYYPPVADRLAA